MRKRLIPIYSVLVVAIVLLAAVCPSCGGGGGGGGAKGTINVQATLCGANWTGSVSYTLTPASGSPKSGTSVNDSFTVATGSWNCTYNSGGPSDAFLVDITPSSSQTVSENGTVTFTLNFEENQDAGIQFLWWTRNGTPVGPPGEPWYEVYDAVVCNLIDVHFQQRVMGCENYSVTLNETDWLSISQTAGPGPVRIFVVNDTWALNKTPEPSQKVFQVPSFNGTPVEAGMSTNLTLGVPTLLDVETQWQLVKDLNYTKSINWFGISKAPFVPPGPHPYVLFELVLPAAGQYTFTLVASAEVALVDDVDVNPVNNNVTSPPLYLTVTVGPGP
jgi:hypothetical protein